MAAVGTQSQQVYEIPTFRVGPWGFYLNTLTIKWIKPPQLPKSANQDYAIHANQGISNAFAVMFFAIAMIALITTLLVTVGYIGYH